MAEKDNVIQFPTLREVVETMPEEVAERPMPPPVDISEFMAVVNDLDEVEGAAFWARVVIAKATLDSWNA